MSIAPEWLEKHAPPHSQGVESGTIREGGRNAALTSIAGSMRHRGMSKAAILAALRQHNTEHCNPKLPDEEVTAIAASVAKYEPRLQHSAKIEPDPDEFLSVRTASGVMAADLPPAKFCVPDRVPCGLVIIGGRPKAKKSWCALQLAIAKANGTPFLGVDTGPATRVLGIFLEDNDRRMRQRLEFFGQQPETAPATLHMVYEWPTGLEGVEKIERWLMQFPDTTLIIIDVLQRFRGPRDPRASAYDGDYLTMGMLHGVTQRHDGLTILVIHHVKKGAVDDPVEALNGTFAIAGAADGYIILRRGEGEQWIAHIDGRDWASWDHDFAWEFREREGWVQIGAAGVNLTEAQREIFDFAKDVGFVTPTKIADLRGISKASAHEALRGLVTKGAMRADSGKYYPLQG